MKIKKMTFNPFGENTYIVWNESTLDCIIIDPGMMSDSESKSIDKFIEDNTLNVVGVTVTHMHVDHVAGVSYLLKQYGVKLSAHSADAMLGERVSKQAAMFGLQINIDALEIGNNLTHNDIIKLGDETLQVIHIPGHSPGGIALHNEKEKFLISGDSLFQYSIGRTDLPGGNHTELITNIKQRLLTLPDDTIVYPGHGPHTTIGEEKRYNPFIA